MADVKTIAESLVNLTIKEANELLTVLKDEYGIEPAAAAVMAGPAGGDGAAGRGGRGADRVHGRPHGRRRRTRSASSRRSAPSRASA